VTEDIDVLRPADYPAAIPDLAALLVDAVESGASVSFLSGLDLPRATLWWQARTADVDSGALVMIVARGWDRIVGCAGLAPATTENGRHRAEVVKVLVLRSHRGRGVASAILQRLESVALGLGRWLLVLDTAVDVGADRLYLGQGWREVGIVPDFAMGTSGELVGTRFMWKRLAR
jgi:GNAT superfamily N-acetyltransferase